MSVNSNKEVIHNIFLMTEVQIVPILQVLKGVLKFVKNPLPVIDDAMTRYGNTYITRIVGGRRMIMTTDLEVVQHVLQQNNHNYIKSEIQTDTLGKYVGNGLLTANGDYWLRQRRLIQPSFSKAKLQTLVHIMEKEIESYCNDLSLKIRKSPIVDIHEEMMELTLRIVSKSLFSTGVSSEEINHLGATITALQEDIIHEIRQPFLAWWRNISGKTASSEQLAEITRKIIQEVIDKRRNGTIGEHDDLLDMLLLSRYEDTGEVMTDKQILDEAIILFVAGHETTAVSLAYTLFELSRQNNLFNKTSELAEQLSTQAWSFQNIMSSDLITRVIEESMRLYPPAWILDRKAEADDEVGTLQIKANDLIGIYIYGIHHDPRFFNNPETFDPDRFLPEAKKKIKKYAYFPFGGGPRMCIGHHFAMMEMKMGLVAILSRFHFEAVDTTTIKLQPLVTLRPKHPILMRITEK